MEQERLRRTRVTVSRTSGIQTPAAPANRTERDRRPCLGAGPTPVSVALRAPGLVVVLLRVPHEFRHGTLFSLCPLEAKRQPGAIRRTGCSPTRSGRCPALRTGDSVAGCTRWHRVRHAGTVCPAESRSEPVWLSFRACGGVRDRGMEPVPKALPRRFILATGVGLLMAGCARSAEPAKGEPGAIRTGRTSITPTTNAVPFPPAAAAAPPAAVPVAAAGGPLDDVAGALQFVADAPGRQTAQVRV